MKNIRISDFIKELEEMEKELLRVHQFLIDRELWTEYCIYKKKGDD